MKLQLTHVKNEFGTDYLFCNHEDNHYHLPLNNAPVLKKFPLLPPLEDETRKLALEMGEDYFSKELFADYFTIGYNKAKEKYKWTDENVKKAIEIAKDSMGVDNDGESCYSHLSTQQIMQSLQQPKYPVAFVLSNNFSNFTENLKHGKYIYE